MNVRELSQKTGEALMRIGWASASIADENGFRIEWTDRGLECLKHLHLGFRDLSGNPLDSEQINLLCTWAQMSAEHYGWDKEVS